MSVGVALFLLWVVSPLAGTIGYLEVAIPARLFGLSARLSRWSLRIGGLDSSVFNSPVLRWLYTPLHRHLFGDPHPATAFDRMCEDPEEFRIVVLGIRLQGILLVIASLSAAVLGAVVLVTG
jgi:hypothetical protein